MLKIKNYENDNLNHFQAMIFAFDNANNIKGRLRVRERLLNAINHYKKNNFDEVN